MQFVELDEAGDQLGQPSDHLHLCTYDSAGNRLAQTAYIEQSCTLETITYTYTILASPGMRANILIWLDLYSSSAEPAHERKRSSDPDGGRYISSNR